MAVKRKAIRKRKKVRRSVSVPKSIQHITLQQLWDNGALSPQELKDLVASLHKNRTITI